MTLVSGGTRRDLGEVPVSGGVARLTQTLPKGVTGTAHLEVKASPSGTTAVLPSFTIAKALVDARLDVVTLPFVKQGSFSLLVARVRGAEGRPTGTVSVTAGETRLGSARLSRGAAVLLLDTRRLAVGRQVLTTAYSGDATYKPAQRDTTVTVLAKRGR